MITELLIGIVSVLFTNPNHLKAPLVQERNVCTVQAIYECEVVVGGPIGDPITYAKQYGNKISERGAKMPHVAKWANRKGIARLDQVRDKKKFIKHMNGGLGVITINNYKEKDKYFVVPSDKPTGGHAMCAVGVYEYGGKDWILARNTVGDGVGIMGYFLVDINTINEMFTFKNK